MRNKLIVFLIRRKFKLKKYQYFRFTNQKSSAIYYFTSDSLIKITESCAYKSGVSLNWLLNDECEICAVGIWL